MKQLFLIASILLVIGCTSVNGTNTTGSTTVIIFGFEPLEKSNGEPK